MDLFSEKQIQHPQAMLTNEETKNSIEEFQGNYFYLSEQNSNVCLWILNGLTATFSAPNIREDALRTNLNNLSLLQLLAAHHWRTNKTILAVKKLESINSYSFAHSSSRN